MPAPARRSAVPAPMPPFAPVTRATLSSSFTPFSFALRFRGSPSRLPSAPPSSVLERRVFGALLLRSRPRSRRYRTPPGGRSRRSCAGAALARPPVRPYSVVDARLLEVEVPQDPAHDLRADLSPVPLGEDRLPLCSYQPAAPGAPGRGVLRVLLRRASGLDARLVAPDAVLVLLAHAFLRV